MREALRPEDLAQFAVAGDDADFAAAAGARAPAAGGVVSVRAKPGAGKDAKSGDAGEVDRPRSGGAAAMNKRDGKGKAGAQKRKGKGGGGSLAGKKHKT